MYACMVYSLQVGGAVHLETGTRIATDLDGNTLSTRAMSATRFSKGVCIGIYPKAGHGVALNMWGKLYPPVTVHFVALW